MRELVQILTIILITPFVLLFLGILLIAWVSAVRLIWTATAGMFLIVVDYVKEKR